MNKLEILEMLAEYYGKELTDNQIKIYLNTLDDILPEDLEKAAFKWIKEGKQFFPKVSELRGMGVFHATDVLHGREETTKMYWRAMAAYNGVLAGRMDGDELDDRRIKSVLDKVEFTEYDEAFDPEKELAVA